MSMLGGGGRTNGSLNVSTNKKKGVILRGTGTIRRRL